MFASLAQLLLDRWPPQEVLVDLETWASQVELRLEEEREGACKACRGDQLTQTLQRYQVHPLFPPNLALQPSLKVAFCYKRLSPAMNVVPSFRFHT